MSVTEEAFNALAERVTALEAQSRKTEAMFGYIYTAIHELDFKIDAITDAITVRFDAIDTRLTGVDTRLASHDRKLDDIVTSVNTVITRSTETDTKLDEILRRLKGTS